MSTLVQGTVTILVNTIRIIIRKIKKILKKERLEKESPIGWTKF